MKFKKNNLILLVILILSLIPILWFVGHPNAIINGVDTNFPLDPLTWFKRRFFVWNNTVNAGNDFSSSVSGLFFHFVQTLPFVLGFSLQSVELVSLVFWFALIVVSSFLLARNIFSKSHTAQIIFVVFYCFNTYIFNTWENVKVSNLALFAALPWFIANIASYKNKNINFRSFIVRNLLGSIFAMGTGINPAYFVTLVIGVGIYSIFSKSFRLFGIFLVILILVNSLWILPTSNFLLFGDKKITNLQDIGFTDWLGSLSANSSLVNILRLQGAWDWYSFESITHAPLYLPYVVNFLYNPPFVVFSFIIPTLAFVAYLFKRPEKRSLYAFFSVLLLLGVFFGSGTHEPTGIIYKILVSKIPFFQFFRSPWYIFTPYLIIAFAGLIALLFENLELRFNKFLVIFSAGILVIGNLIYNYPLVTGKIFRPSRQDGFYVNFPNYIWQTKDYLSKLPNFPRLIGYPNETLESFAWGYKGIEPLISLFSNKEIISSSNVSQSHELSVLMKNFYNLLEKGKYLSAKLAMPALGADTLFYKTDTSTLAPQLTPDIENFFKKETVGEWEFLKALDIKDLQKISSPEYVYVTPSDITNTYTNVIDLLEPNSLVVNSNDSVLYKINNINPEFDFKKLLYYQAINTTYKANPTGELQSFEVEVGRESEYFFGLQDFAINTQDKVQISVDAREYTLPVKKTDSLFVFGPVRLLAGQHKINVKFPKAQNLFTLNSYKNLSTTKALRSEDLPLDLNTTLLAFNDSEKAKPIYLPISNFNPFLSYQFSFDYKYEYGSIPIFEILQFTDRSPIKTFPVYLGGAMDWENKSTIIDPIPTESKLDVHLTLPRNANGNRSKALVQNLSLKSTYQNSLFVVEKSEIKNKFSDTPRITFIQNSPTEYNFELSGNSNFGQFLIFVDNYNSNWQLLEDGRNENKLHFTANGYANGWYITSNTQKFKLYYKPQSFFAIGIGISTVTIFAIASFYFISKFKRHD